MADGIVFDKTSYTKGDAVTATVTLAGQTTEVDTPTTYTSTYTSADGKLSVTSTFTVHTEAPVVQSVGTLTDTGNHVWVLVAGSYDGVTAKFTTTA